MVREDWVVGGDRHAAAADRIYAAATELVLRDGLDAFDLDRLAATVHCSRATIYRYAGGKARIRDAIIVRLAAQIVDHVRRAVEGLTGPERMVTAITVAVEDIRSDPVRRMMMGPRGPDLSQLPSSPVLGSLAADLTGITGDDAQAAEWIVRVVMSLAYWPVGNRKLEHEMVERFVAPAFSR